MANVKDLHHAWLEVLICDRIAKRAEIAEEQADEELQDALDTFAELQKSQKKKRK